MAGNAASVAGDRTSARSLSHGVRECGFDGAIEEAGQLRGCAERNLPFAALPAPPRPFIDADKLGSLDDGEAASSALDEQPFAEACWLRPGLIAEVAAERGILMDVRSVFVALPPHPRLRIDAKRGSRILLPMPEHLAASCQVSA